MTLANGDPAPASGPVEDSEGETSSTPLATEGETFKEWLPCAKKRLILFDIDGTLIRCGRQVGPMFLDSMHAVFGSRGDWRNYSFSGKTDGQIVVELLERSGHAREWVLSKLSAVQERYLFRVERELDPGQMVLLPGVMRLLEWLEDDPEMHLGLVTGNWERGGRAKLAPFDLNRFFPFGAFGDDGEDRALLPRAAMSRACSHIGREFLAEEVLVVGDTPNDVRCAHANGLQCLAVATGTVSADELRASGADWVMTSLEGLGLQHA